MNILQSTAAVIQATITVTNPGEEPKDYTLTFTPLPADQPPETPAKEQ